MPLYIIKETKFPWNRAKRYQLR